jgi:hypothetical protein
MPTKKARIAPRAPRRVRLPAATLRALVLATLAVGATVWAIVHHYTRHLPPMIVPVDAGGNSSAEPEIPVEPLEGD